MVSATSPTSSINSNSKPLVWVPITISSSPLLSNESTIINDWSYHHPHHHLSSSSPKLISHVPSFPLSIPTTHHSLKTSSSSSSSILSSSPVSYLRTISVLPKNHTNRQKQTSHNHHHHHHHPILCRFVGPWTVSTPSKPSLAFPPAPPAPPASFDKGGVLSSMTLPRGKLAFACSWPLGMGGGGAGGSCKLNDNVSISHFKFLPI